LQTARNDGAANGLCGIAAASSTSAAARRGSVVMRNRAFRVTPAISARRRGQSGGRRSIRPRDL